MKRPRSGTFNQSIRIPKRLKKHIPLAVLASLFLGIRSTETAWGTRNYNYTGKPYPVALCRRLLLHYRNNNEYLLLTVLQLFAGLRWSEVEHARWEDVNWNNGTIWVANRNKYVRLYCALDWLLMLRPQSATGLISRQREIRFAHSVRAFLKLQYQPSGLRHTFLCYCDPETLSAHCPSLAPDAVRKRLFQRKEKLFQSLTPALAWQAEIGARKLDDSPEISQPITTTGLDLV